MAMNLWQYIRRYGPLGAPTAPPVAPPTINPPVIASTSPGLFQVGVPLTITPASVEGHPEAVVSTPVLLVNGTTTVLATATGYTPVNGDVGLSLIAKCTIAYGGQNYVSYSSVVGPVSAAPAAGDPVIAAQTAAFGQLTAAGAGDWAPVNTGGPITSAAITGGANASHWQISATGVITPSAAGVAAGLAAGPYSLTCQYNGTVSQTHTINILASTRSVASTAQFTAVQALAKATLDGTTILGRACTVAWPNGINAGFFNKKGFTTGLTISSHDSANPMIFDITKRQSDGSTPGSHPGCELRNAGKITFTHVIFDAYWDPAILVQGIDDNSAGLIIHGADGLVFQYIEARSNMLAMAQAGNVDGGYKGIIATDAINAGGIQVLDSKLHGSYRVLQLLTTATTYGLTRVERCEFYDYTSDCFILAGSHPDLHVNDNYFHNPLTFIYPTLNATVNVAANTITTSVPHNYSIGRPVVINFLSSSTVLPSPVIAGHDYHGTVLDAYTVQFTDVTLTTTGSGVQVTKEPAHADCIQGLPGVGAIFAGEIRRNRFLIRRDDAINFTDDSQMLFLEDCNSASNPDTTHYNLIVEGNLGYSRTATTLSVYNCYNTHIFNNVMVSPMDAIPSQTATIGARAQYGGSRAGNVLCNNIAKSVSTEAPAAGDVVTNNIICYPDPQAGVGQLKYSDVFVDPGVPTDLADFERRFAIKPGGPADLASPKAGNVGTGYYSTPHTSASPSEPVSITGPKLTAVSGTPSGGGAAALGATTDKGDGTFYWIVSTSSKRPQPVQVQANQDGLGNTAKFSGSSAVSATGAQAKTATGLTAGATYYPYAMHVDGLGNYSTVVAGASFVAT